MSWLQIGTVGNNIKYDKVSVYSTDNEYNKSVNAEVFNKYFLTIAKVSLARLWVIINHQLY